MQIRKIIRLVAGFAATVVALPVIGQWFIALAEELDWYKSPVETAGFVISLITDSQWFPWTGGVVFGFAIGTWLDALLRRKEREPILSKARTDLTGLADEADDVANELQKIVGETQFKPPGHPDFVDSFGSASHAKMWQQSMHEKSETAVRQYRNNYSTRCWKIIETAKVYIDIPQRDIWPLSTTISSPNDLDCMARLLNTISAKLRFVKVMNN